MRGDLTLNFMAQIHTSVTLLASRDLTWNSGRLTCQHVNGSDLRITFRERLKNTVLHNWMNVLHCVEIKAKAK
jgi:hypothetical protein